jgi:hypothetical protein
VLTDTLVRVADDALQDAKRAGGDRVRRAPVSLPRALTDPGDHPVRDRCVRHRLGRSGHR